MRPVWFAALFSAAVLPVFPQGTVKSPFAGRWDLTIKTSADAYPSWMEFADEGGSPQVRVVGRVASAHEAKDVKVDGARLTFTTSEWFGKTIPVQWEINASAGKLTGTQKRGDGVTGKLTGVQAPALNREVSAWGKAEPLFNGKDTTGWEPLLTEPGKPVQSNWRAINGELVNTAPGGEHPNQTDLPGFQTACGVQLSDGWKQWSLFARPL